MIYLVGWLATKPVDVPCTDLTKKEMNSFVDASRMGLKSMLEVRPIIDHFSITVGFRGIGTTYVSINGLMEGTLAIYVERHVTLWSTLYTYHDKLARRGNMVTPSWNQDRARFLGVPDGRGCFLRSTMHQTLSNTIS